MAKLGMYYGLCPLIDQTSLLGISEDNDNDCVIVTLGRNMAIKYQLGDQKQVHSWSTKDHLTSSIVYDKNLHQYVAVFNNNYIRIFGSDCENLDRIKKYKFQNPIHTLISSPENDTLVVFKNGAVSSVSYAIENRKSIARESILLDSDTIESVNCISFEKRVIVSYLVKDASGELKLFVVFLNENLEKEDTRSVASIKMSRKAVSLTGHLLLIKDETLELLTLWSDAKLFSFPLNRESEFPGNLLSIIEVLNCQQKVCMTSLNNTYIGLYGADKNQEGSTLVVYNTQFQVAQCVQPFKLYTLGSKLFHVEGNILLTVGNNLAVVPYQLATEQLAELVGSHHVSAVHYKDPDIEIITELQVGNWDDDESDAVLPNFRDIPLKSASVKRQITGLLNEGYTESLICKQIFPDLIEKKSIDEIFEVLDYFTEVPEDILTDLLVLILTDVSAKQSAALISSGQCSSLNKILSLPYNDVTLMPFLREKLSFTSSLTLLQYICTLLGGDNEKTLNENDYIRSEQKLVEWGSMLLDINYQKFLFSKDEQVVNLLKTFQELVAQMMTVVRDFDQVLPHLEMIKRGQYVNRNKRNISKWYSIEKINLY